MLISYKRGQGSIILRLLIRNKTSSAGDGLTGLVYNSSGLSVSTIADNEASATVYTVAASKIEDITTLGTYAAPTATKCRFKEVDATNHPGIYELQIADARFAVSSAKSLLVTVKGATDASQVNALIPLTDWDPYDAAGTFATSLRDVFCQTPVPGSFDTGSIGYLIGTMLDAPITGRATPAEAAAAVFATAFGGFTFDEVIKIIAAREAGKSSGFESNAPVYRDLDDSKNVITGTLDTNGNRTAVSYNP